MAQLEMDIAPMPWGDGPMPLSYFPEDKQREIAEAVAQPAPPPRWLDLGIAQITSRAWYEWYRQRGRKFPGDARPRIPRWMRRLVIERDGLVCGLCGGEVPEVDVHIDHIEPVALGGPTRPDNLQVAHSRCNIAKGARV